MAQSRVVLGQNGKSDCFRISMWLEGIAFTASLGKPESPGVLAIVTRPCIDTLLGALEPQMMIQESNKQFLL